MNSLRHELPDWFKWDLPPRPDTTTTEAPEDDVNFSVLRDDANLQYLDESYINLHKEEIRRPPKESVQKLERIGADARLPAVGTVSFVVHSEAFEGRSLRLTCVASIYNLYVGRDELVFDMEQPEVSPVLGVRNGAPGKE